MPLNEEEKRAISSWAAEYLDWYIERLDESIENEKILGVLEKALAHEIKSERINLSDKMRWGDVRDVLRAVLKKKFPSPDELWSDLPSSEKAPLFSISSKEEPAPQEMFAIRTKGKRDKTALDWLNRLLEEDSEYLTEIYGITKVHRQEPTKPHIQEFDVTNDSGASYRVSAVQESDALSYRTNLTGSEEDQREAIARICQIAVDAAPPDHIFDLSETPEDKKIMVLFGLTRALRNKNKTEDEIEKLIPDSVNYRHLRFSP